MTTKVKLSLKLQLRYGLAINQFAIISEDASSIPRIGERVWYNGRSYLIEDLVHEFTDKEHLVVMHAYQRT